VAISKLDLKTKEVSVVRTPSNMAKWNDIGPGGPFGHLRTGHQIHASAYQPAQSHDQRNREPGGAVVWPAVQLNSSGDLIGAILIYNVANFTFGGPQNNIIYALNDSAIYAVHLQAKGAIQRN
jgi:hypothetical protein